MNPVYAESIPVLGCSGFRDMWLSDTQLTYHQAIDNGIYGFVHYYPFYKNLIFSHRCFSFCIQIFLCFLFFSCTSLISMWWFTASRGMMIVVDCLLCMEGFHVTRKKYSCLRTLLSG